MQQGKNCLPGVMTADKMPTCRATCNLAAAVLQLLVQVLTVGVLLLPWRGLSCLPYVQERVVTRTRDANGNLITEEHNAGWSTSHT
jgi:hypothetical protein